MLYFSVLNCILIFALLRSCICTDRLYRAYIPSKSIQWFNEFVYSLPQFDVWLSARHNTNSSKSLKYISEFRVKSLKTENELLDQFEKKGIKLEVLIDDLIKYIDNKINRERRFTENHKRIGAKKIVGKYVSYSEITDWLSNLAKKHPTLVQTLKIGKTFENRPIMVLKMSNTIKNKENKPLFLYESGIHAREWISIATNLFIIDRLINKFLRNDETVVKLLSKFELHFIPVVNPDGYEYSRRNKYNRYWRKNMRFTKAVSSEYSCFGVDLNRNFDHKWMVSGASANPCSEVYAGTHPASEAEVKSIINYIMSKSPRWISYISLHCYGAVWLSPYSYSKKHIQENFEETCQKAMVAIDKIDKTHKFKFKFGSASYELYEASGCGEDWGHAIANINHTYVIELKPEKSETPEAGFEHPEQKISETALEMYDGFLEYMKTFLGKTISPEIVKECQNKLKDMKNELENIIEYDSYDEPLV